MAALASPIYHACIKQSHVLKRVCQASPSRTVGRRYFSGARRLASKYFPSTQHQISQSERKINIPWEDGKTSSYHHIWLRDHCRSKECFHEITNQRLLETAKIPKDIAPASFKAEEEGLRIVWNHGGHESFYSYDWLHRHSYSPVLERPTEEPQTLWGKEIMEQLPTIQYDEVMGSDEGVGKWLTMIHKFGISFVENTPATPEATEKLLERIAFIRLTHYGGFYDFTPNLEHGDTAYTNIALKAHTDTTYFSDPCGLQMFHILGFDGTGGESLLVDGFKAARTLRSENPKAYGTLSRVRVPTHSAGDVDKCIRPSIGNHAFPIINHDPATGMLYQIRYNNDDRSTMTAWQDDSEVEDFYDALRAWEEVLTRPSEELWFPLKPGTALVFDNWRVLHGRAAFTGSNRRMCGGYINRDDYESRRRLTTLGREKVMFDL